MNEAMEKEYETGDILDLFKQVMNDADESGTSMELTVGDRTMDLRSIYYETMHLVEQATESEETEFLVAPLLRRAMDYVPSLYFFSLEEYLEKGIEEKLSRYHTLTGALDKSPVLQHWQNIYRDISRVIEQMGMKPDNEMLQDMSRVAEILLDAFRFTKQYAFKRVKVSSGQDSNKQPILVNAMPRFSLLGEFHDCLRSIGHECCVMLAVIAPTYTQQLDPLDIWAGRKPEVLYNSYRYERDFDPDRNTYLQESFVAIGVKRGKNIWFLYNKDNTAWRGSFMEYGKRQSYLPYQVLFNDPPAPDKECTSLAVPGSAWTLNRIADQEQALWLPILLMLLQREYFSGELDLSEPVLITRDAVRLEAAAVPPATLVPAVITQLTVSSDVIQVPEGIHTSPACEEFIQRLNLCAEDIAGLNISPVVAFGTAAEYELHLWHRSRYALSIIGAQRLQEDWKQNGERLRRWHVQLSEKNREYILAELGKEGSLIDRISTHVVNGRKQYHEDGSPVMESKGYYREEVHATDRTSIYDTQRYRQNPQALICEPGSLEGKRPPVMITIAASTPGELAALAGIPVEQLPWQYQLWGKCRKECRIYTQAGHDSDPMFYLDNPYSGKVPVVVAMDKKTYKKLVVSTNPARAY